MSKLDHNTKKPSKIEQRQEEFEKRLVHYFDERLLNVVEQVRAVCIAAGVTPEAFQKAFVDQEAQEMFYVKLHAAEDIFKAKLQAEAQNLAPTAPPTDPVLKELTKGAS